MKKLFEVEGHKAVLYLANYRAFRVDDFETKQRCFFDEDGNAVDQPDFRVYETKSD